MGRTRIFQVGALEFELEIAMLLQASSPESIYCRKTYRQTVRRQLVSANMISITWTILIPEVEKISDLRCSFRLCRIILPSSLDVAC